MQQDNNKFNIFLPFDTITKSVDEKTGKTVMKIGGVISNSLTGPDLDGEIIDVEGMDFTKFLNKGFINYHHLASKDPSAIIGEPIKAYVKDGKAHFEGILYPESEMAQKVYDLANVLSKSSSTRKLGYSIEGAAVARDERNPKRIRKSSISGLAVTPFPKNGGTELTVLKGEVEYETLPDSDLLIDITDSNGVRWTVDKNLTLEKSEQSEELEKAGGEGSRGGKIIGHTKSGKPIYDTASHEGHKDFSGQDHREARAVHEKKAMKHYDTMHTAGVPVNKRRASGQKYTNHMNQANSHMESAYSKDNGISKAMSAGSITGTETHNQSLTQEPLKQESIAGTEGEKKKKKNYKKLLENMRKRRGDKDPVIDLMSKAEVDEMLTDLELSDEEKFEVFELAQEIEKGGEGSRGGKIIGHTKSGKPIYSKFNHPDHKNFSAQDHKDASKLFSDKSKNSDRADVKYANRSYKHKMAAWNHKDNLKKSESDYISKAEVFTQLISEHNLDIESAKHVYMLAEAIEKGGSSRGQRATI